MKIFEPTNFVVGFFVLMKNLTKNWIAVLAIMLFVILGGYFVFTNGQNQGESVDTSSSQEQQVQSQVEVKVDYAGEVEKEIVVKTIEIDEGDTAWDSLKTAVDEENIEYQDYGGELGIFVQGINGVKPTGNKFWLFKVNGEGAKVGASSYKVQPGDKIEFVISEPMEGV